MKQLLTLLIVLASSSIFAQTLYTRTDTIAITQDTVTFKAGQFSGEIQWQHSSDSINWKILPDQRNQILKLSKYAQGTYRAEILAGTCNPVYSDTATIKSELPVVVTDSVSAVTDSSAVVYGTIKTDGGAKITAKGTCYNKTGSPSIADSIVYSNIDSIKFHCMVPGLNPNTTYFVNAFASNLNGTVYGTPIEIKTEELKFSVTKHVEASSGATIKTPDGSSLTIPAGALPESGNITIASVENKDLPDIPNKNFMIFGKPYSITFPGNSLTGNITFTYTLDSLPDFLESYVPYLYKNNSYYPVEYKINGNTVTVTIDTITLNNQSSTKSATLLGEAITLLSLIAIQAPPTSQMGLKEVDLSNGNMFFAEPSAVSDTSKILLLIHGWTDKPETWTNFIQKIKIENDIKFDKIWTFGYNSSLGIDENGAKLSGGLAIYTHGAKVKIVAHSMGGLVARSMIENYGGSIYVKKLITLGTPHLGSPLGAIRDILGAVITIESTLAPEKCVPGTSFIYDYKTQGFQDLAENSSFIAAMKTTSTSPVPYYCIAAVNKPSDNILIPGEDDFAVGLSSALGAPTPISSGKTEITCSFPDIAHNNLLINAGVFNKTKEYLKDNYSLKVIQGDNQQGKPGEKLQLPIIVQVLNEIDKPVKNEKVYFESEYYPGNYSGITTREDGKVAVEWTLDDVEGAQKIQVYLKDDNGKKIDTSVVTITAEAEPCGCDESKFDFFTDSRDGHVYKTIKIGAQTWMAENLAYLPYTTPTGTWSNTEPCYYVYDRAAYGVLYNWPAALNACPAGWHLPSDAEWTTLSNYLGGKSVAGGKMKSTTGWNSPNTGATNESCFSALPGGNYDCLGNGFVNSGYHGFWWGSAAYDEHYAWYRGLHYNGTRLLRSHNCRISGFSVRCVRD